MRRIDRAFVAGHRGLVGSAIERALRQQGGVELLLRTRAELDLTDARAVDEFFAQYRPDHVYLAAARVGGILANQTHPADFIRDNLAIQQNVITSAHRHGVDRMLFLGSSCIYPKLAPQPLCEAYLLTGALEPTNRAYAVAKIAGIEMCWSFNRQLGTQYLCAMPTNLYGPGDNYHAEHGHVIPGLMRRVHDAKESGRASVQVWGTGTPRREFLYCDDMASACLHLMSLPDTEFRRLLGSMHTDDVFDPPIVNVGVGEDVTIAQLASLVCETVGFKGGLKFDTSRPDGTPRKLLDVSKLQSTGWKPRVPLREGLQAAYVDFQGRYG